MTSLPFIALLHFWVGTAAVVAGFAAFCLRKGCRLHRVSGLVFFTAIIFLSFSGLYLSVMRSVIFTVFISVLAFYLVTTGWMSAKRADGEIGRFEKLACLIILLFAIIAIVIGYKAATGSTVLTKNVPAGAYFTLAGLAILLGGFDINLIHRSGLYGKHRIARHLWRMCFALFIAVTIFFLGNNNVLPEVLRKPVFLAAPIFAVLLLTVYWIVRVLYSKKSRKTVIRPTSTKS